MNRSVIGKEVDFRELSCNNSGYYNKLPFTIQKLIKDLTKESFENEMTVEVYNTEINDIECHNRDGFIPHPYNKGGIDVQGYADLGTMRGSGLYPHNESSRNRIDDCIASRLETCNEEFFEQHEEALKAIGIDDASKVNYNDIEEKNYGLALDYSVAESDSVESEYDTVLFQYRVMYHGVNARGVHSLTVWASMNTEAPYHRGKYDDNVSEMTITWKTMKSLKVKLARTLKKTAKEVF